MNRPVHFEVQVPDPEVVQPFYERVFGWKFVKWSGPQEYWLVTTGGDTHPGINGGFMRSPDGQPRTVNTIAVADVDAACAQITSNGGTIVVPKFAVTGVGYVAYALDPGGALFGATHEDRSAV